MKTRRKSIRKGGLTGGFGELGLGLGFGRKVFSTRREREGQREVGMMVRVLLRVRRDYREIPKGGDIKLRG